MLLALDLNGDQGPNITFRTSHDNVVEDAVGQQGRLVRLAGWIDLDSELAVRLFLSHHYQANCSSLAVRVQFCTTLEVAGAWITFLTTKLQSWPSKSGPSKCLLYRI